MRIKRLFLIAFLVLPLFIGNTAFAYSRQAPNNTGVILDTDLPIDTVVSSADGAWPVGTVQSVRLMYHSGSGSTVYSACTAVPSFATATFYAGSILTTLPVDTYTGWSYEQYLVAGCTGTFSAGGGSDSFAIISGSSTSFDCTVGSDDWGTLCLLMTDYLPRFLIVVVFFPLLLIGILIRFLRNPRSM